MPEEAFQDTNSRLEKVAVADTTSRRLKFRKDGVVVEVKVDDYDVQEGDRFKELEIELKGSNNTGILSDLRGSISERFGFEEINKQKYARVIESMDKYRHVWGE